MSDISACSFCDCDGDPVVHAVNEYTQYTQPADTQMGAFRVGGAVHEATAGLQHVRRARRCATTDGSAATAGGARARTATGRYYIGYSYVTDAIEEDITAQGSVVHGCRVMAPRIGILPSSVSPSCRS
ncbi:hypothetical protein CYMTET_56561 [Cymbomonas tetramitiformis]|uniref:Uncharacterized protein n=1 Tax=Cymbomonas tetramitiformis TaxID=36881 RepID=A0AAE0EM65_9CHLO|nr:hypothetical protein CYMTET_56561 [Cymbomonas tetramitiformis]